MTHLTKEKSVQSKSVKRYLQYNVPALRGLGEKVQWVQFHWSTDWLNVLISRLVWYCSTFVLKCCIICVTSKSSQKYYQQISRMQNASACWSTPSLNNSTDWLPCNRSCETVKSKLLGFCSSWSWTVFSSLQIEMLQTAFHLACWRFYFVVLLELVRFSFSFFLHRRMQSIFGRYIGTIECVF